VFAAVGFSFAYHATNSVGDEDALAVIRRAAELGQSFLDTSDVYGPHTNEKLLCARLSSLCVGAACSCWCAWWMPEHVMA
jgi:aryl-alcohol dehydrogenase-like predicted oxidoreductase